jgi:site-specific DNA recombinase
LFVVLLIIGPSSQELGSPAIQGQFTALDRRQERSERKQAHIAELNKRATETDLRLKRLYDAIESGVANLDDPELKVRISRLKAARDQARVDADCATASLDHGSRKSITPQLLNKFARTARERMRMEGGGYRRDHFRALAQRVEVDTGEVRIIRSKSNLLHTLTAGARAKTKLGAVLCFVPKWCARRDSNPWPPD